MPVTEMNIAIIPARGGSKRLPKKNIREFCGKPMIAWSIDLAIRSQLFKHVVVSTDDSDIADIATKYGAEVPFLRPKSLSDDHTPTAPVICHAINTLISMGLEAQNYCCIYPCAPFLDVKDLIAAESLSKTSAASFVYPVSEFPHPIQRALRRSQDGGMQFLQPEYELTRTQDLEITYHDAGQFYWGKIDSWLSGERMHSAGCGLQVPKWRVVDIDDEQDWIRAEFMYKALVTSAA
jgi:pseudaminic acid cytidylyltransferase